MQKRFGEFDSTNESTQRLCLMRTECTIIHLRHRMRSFSDIEMIQCNITRFAIDSCKDIEGNYSVQEKFDAVKI